MDTKKLVILSEKVENTTLLAFHSHRLKLALCSHLFLVTQTQLWNVVAGSTVSPQSSSCWCQLSGTHIPRNPSCLLNSRGTVWTRTITDVPCHQQCSWNTTICAWGVYCGTLSDAQFHWAGNTWLFTCYRLNFFHLLPFEFKIWRSGLFHCDGTNTVLVPSQTKAEPPIL